MLTGILVPSSGRISVAGLEPSRQRVQLARRIGVMFGQRMQLWWDLPLADSFELLRHIYSVPADRHRENLAASASCSTWTTSCRFPCASSRSASGCAAS